MIILLRFSIEIFEKAFHSLGLCPILKRMLNMHEKVQGNWKHNAHLHYVIVVHIILFILFCQSFLKDISKTLVAIEAAEFFRIDLINALSSECAVNCVFYNLSQNKLFWACYSRKLLQIPVGCRIGSVA